VAPSTSTTGVTATATVTEPARVTSPAVGAIARSDASGTAQTPVVLFEFDKAVLTDEGKHELATYAAALPKHRLALRVTGYTDRLGPVAYNEQLSSRRAKAVRAYLAGRLGKRVTILAVARGKRGPVKTCEGELTPELIACLAPNRRAELALVPGRRK
jgi:OOP family OmpA-OmpF porin